MRALASHVAVVAIMCVASISSARAAERQQNFDVDPQWDGHNHRAVEPPPREVRQDFGFSTTNHAGGAAAGELGGLLTPCAETAYFAKRIEPATFEDRLTASGKFSATDRNFHVLVGFFNSKTINEWRAPNSILIRLYGRGDVFYAYVEYATSRWRAGGDNPGGFALEPDPERPERKRLRGFASGGKSHTWSLSYDPAAYDGRGGVTVTIDDETAICELDPGHKQDGATFDRFGLLNIPKHFDTGGEVWLDDIFINGDREQFDTDPTFKTDPTLKTDSAWEAVGNRGTHVTQSVRPRFDFGFSPTQFAGGAAPGELGGVVFRGDVRYPNRMAYYGDRLATLSLAKPIVASGKVAMRRGISDSTTLLGFFHSQDSIRTVESPSSGFPLNFLGLALEGPSREGFFIYPVLRTADDQAYAYGDELPRIMPNGESIEWSLRYEPASSDPASNSSAPRIVLSAAGRTAELKLKSDEGGKGASPTARFDRFGLITTCIDGNAQHVYFDDLTYTVRQE